MKDLTLQLIVCEYEIKDMILSTCKSGQDDGRRHTLTQVVHQHTYTVVMSRMPRLLDFWIEMFDWIGLK